MLDDIKVEYGPFINAYAIDAELDLCHHKIANRELQTSCARHTTV